MESPAEDIESDDILSQYYERSFAMHEDLLSSQIIDPATSECGSFLTDQEQPSMVSTSLSQISCRDQLIQSRLASSHLSNLKEIPTAAYLLSITPQTMTINIVVGIISISQPRTLKTRRGGKFVDLIELIVGDETGTGFGINIWVPSPIHHSHALPREWDLRSDALDLRPRDILLAKQVALSSFKGKVYGQSLRRGTTTLDLLYRVVLDGEDKRGAYKARYLEDKALEDPHIRKVESVRKWVLKFVGSNAALSPSKRRRRLDIVSQRQLQTLPSDTP